MVGPCWLIGHGGGGINVHHIRIFLELSSSHGGLLCEYIEYEGWGGKGKVYTPIIVSQQDSDVPPPFYHIRRYYHKSTLTGEMDLPKYVS